MTRTAPKQNQSIGQLLAGPMSQMWNGGRGPARTTLQLAFSAVGLDVDDYPGTKEGTVSAALWQADDETATRLVEELLDLLAASGTFEEPDDAAAWRITQLRRALAEIGATLSRYGQLVWGDAPPSRRTAAAPAFQSNSASRGASFQVETTTRSQPDHRKVFLVHGRDMKARTELVKLLQAFDLRIVDWPAASRATGNTSPTTAEVIEAGMREAHAIVVLFTPDDLGKCKDQFLEGPHDGGDEREFTGQARLNVIFEAGIAWGQYRPQTVLVEIGYIRRMSDLAGVQAIRLTNSNESRVLLRDRLKNAGLAVDDQQSGWLSAGDFDSLLAEVRPEPATASSPQAQQSVIEETNSWRVVAERLAELHRLHPTSQVELTYGANLLVKFHDQQYDSSSATYGTQVFVETGPERDDLIILHWREDTNVRGFWQQLRRALQNGVDSHLADALPALDQFILDLQAAVDRAPALARERDRAHRAARKGAAEVPEPGSTAGVGGVGGS